MIRALLLLLTIVPTALCAHDERVTASCVSPAIVEPRAPRPHGGDRIVFTRGTDWRVGVATLGQDYSLLVYFPSEHWNVSMSGIFVPPLTQAQIAELRCDPAVERIILGARTPESFTHERPASRIRLGITYFWQPVGQLLPQGVYVTRLEPGGVGEKAGLQVQDHIVKLDGRAIDYGSDLLDILATKKPGDTVSLIVIRNGIEAPLIAQF